MIKSGNHPTKVFQKGCPYCNKFIKGKGNYKRHLNTHGEML